MIVILADHLRGFLIIFGDFGGIAEKHPQCGVVTVEVRRVASYGRIRPLNETNIIMSKSAEPSGDPSHVRAAFIVVIGPKGHAATEQRKKRCITRDRRSRSHGPDCVDASGSQGVSHLLALDQYAAPASGQLICAV
jgi:hypothetical protein